MSRDDAGVREEWLFNLDDDPGETVDLLPPQREAAQRLRESLSRWERDVRAER